MNGYLREFENRNRWFFGAGAGIVNYPVTRRLSVTGMAHYWNQPVGLSFDASTGKSGGALDVSGSYKVMITQKSRLKYLSVDLGVICKTAGFLPEEVVLDGHFGLRFGLSIGLRRK